MRSSPSPVVLTSCESLPSRLLFRQSQRLTLQDPSGSFQSHNTSHFIVDVLDGDKSVG